jgi:hypothetical protein
MSSNWSFEVKKEKILTALFSLTVISTIFTGYKILGSSLVGISLALLMVSLLANNIRLNYRELAATILLVGYTVVVVFSADEKYHILQNIRYWYGSIFYIYLFKSYSSSKFISFRFFRFACTIYLLEALLINTIIDSSLIHQETSDLHHVFLNFYERPVGFTANPGTTLVFLISYLYFVEIYHNVRASMFDLFLLTCSVLLSFSTTAIVVYVVYMFLKFITIQGLRLFHRIWLVLVFVILILMPLTYIFINTDEQQLQKYSAEYLVRIVEQKINVIYQIDDPLMFGEQLNVEIPATSGDFGLMVLFQHMGLVGLLVYIILLLFNKFDYKYLPVLFLIHFGSLHYPSAFSPAGQLLTAMILIVRNNSSLCPTHLDIIPNNKKY